MVFWLERTLAMPWLRPRRFPLYALQSPHADGRMMAHVISCFGSRSTLGSSNRQPCGGLRVGTGWSSQSRFPLAVL